MPLTSGTVNVGYISLSLPLILVRNTEGVSRWKMVYQ
jgi:hypothetical protein